MKNNFFFLTILCFVLGFLACQKEQTTKEKNINQSTELRTSNLCPGGENNPAVVYMTDSYTDGDDCCVTLRFWSAYFYYNARIVTSDATGGAGNTTTYSPVNIGSGYVEDVCFATTGVLEFSVQILDGSGTVIACNIFTNPCM